MITVQAFFLNSCITEYHRPFVLLLGCTPDTLSPKNIQNVEPICVHGLSHHFFYWLNIRNSSDEILHLRFESWFIIIFPREYTYIYLYVYMYVYHNINII